MNPINHQARFFSDNGRPVRVLHFIYEYTLQHKQAPTIREVGEGCNISSTSVVNYYVEELIGFGCLEKPEKSVDGFAKARFLRLTETGLNNIGLETVICSQCGSHIVGKHRIDKCLRCGQELDPAYDNCQNCGTRRGKS